MTEILLMIVALNMASVMAESDSFFIRHYSGMCLAHNSADGSLIFQSLCKDRFKFVNGARLFHESTKKCIFAVDSRVSLSADCSTKASILLHFESTNTITHLATGFCFRGSRDTVSPAENETLSISAGCSHNKNRFYFLQNAYYVIRHSSTMCWVYDKNDHLLKLKKTHICDRFEFTGGRKLKHVATGKCVHIVNSLLKIETECSTTSPTFQLFPNKVIYLPSFQKCVHPDGGAAYPAEGTNLVIYSCIDETRFHWYFFDDRDILRTRIYSEVCADKPSLPCDQTKGQIIVNGYDYSLQGRGINIAVFDYFSGILETTITRDTFTTAKDGDIIASFLQSIPSGKIILIAVRDASYTTDNLHTVLQSLGVSATYAPNTVKLGRYSLAAAFHSKETRLSWEASVTKTWEDEPSLVEQTIYPFRDSKGLDDCSKEMGLRTGRLPNKRFTAESVFDDNQGSYAAHHARLHNTKAWCAGRNSPISDYLQIDLGEIKFLTGVALQGLLGQSIKHPVNSFKIKFSNDGKKWLTYTEDGISQKTFDGVNNFPAEIKVNWFRRTEMRYLRIIPLSRYTDLGTHCLRMELFGCKSATIFFQKETENANGYHIGDYVTENISFHDSISANSRDIRIEVSTAADSASLSKHIDQFHYHNINQSVINSNSQMVSIKANITKLSNNVMKLFTAATINFDDLQPSELPYQLKVFFGFWVIDSQLNTGAIWNSYTYKTADKIFAIALPTVIRRHLADYSVIGLDVSNLNVKKFENGDTLEVNVSYASIMEGTNRSNSNAYNVGLFIYFNRDYLTLKSMNAFQKNDRSFVPFMNKTKPGYASIETDIFGPINNHHFQFQFAVTVPSVILKPTNINGKILYEFRYLTNSAKFNGKWNVSLGNSLQCTFLRQRRVVSYTSAHLVVPDFSIVYDDVNNVVIMCKKKQLKTVSFVFSCFFQGTDNATWSQVAFFSSVVGIDTEKREFYGTDVNGKVLMRSSFDLRYTVQIEDSEWDSLKSKPQIRIGKTVSSIGLLPTALTSDWVLPSQANPIIAVTKTGVHRNIGGRMHKTMRL